MARTMSTCPSCLQCNETLDLISNRPLVQGYQVREYKCPKCETVTRAATHWDHSLTEPHGHFPHK
jgi:transposase-like protein